MRDFKRNSVNKVHIWFLICLLEIKFKIGFWFGLHSFCPNIFTGKNQNLFLVEPKLEVGRGQTNEPGRKSSSHVRRRLVK